MLPLQVSESSRKRSGKATRSWEDHHQQRNGASVMAPLLVKAVCARMCKVRWSECEGTTSSDGPVEDFLAQCVLWTQGGVSIPETPRSSKEGLSATLWSCYAQQENVIDIVKLLYVIVILSYCFVWSSIGYSSWVLFSLHWRTLKAASANLVWVWITWLLLHLCFRGTKIQHPAEKLLIVLQENWYKQIGVDLRRVPKSEGTVTIHSFLLDSSRFALNI